MYVDCWISLSCVCVCRYWLCIDGLAQSCGARGLGGGRGSKVEELRIPTGWCRVWVGHGEGDEEVVRQGVGVDMHRCVGVVEVSRW